MIRHRWAGVLIVALFCATLLSQSPRETYQRALVEEQAAGNLKEAIALYRRAATEAGTDRELAATSLLRAASAEEMLGDPHATESYAEILSTYAEQSSQAAVAQARLTALRRATSSASQTTTAQSDLPSVVQSTLREYCVTCHDQSRHVANLNFEALLTHKVSEDTSVWETALQRLRARRDPPAGMPRPDEGTYQTMISLLEVALDQAYPINATLSTAPRVTDQELADRIVVFLWGPGSKPDGELLDAARRGRLRDSAALEQQVQRMLKDGRASALTVNFLEPLFVGRLQRLAESEDRDPRLDVGLLNSLATETRLFLQSQIREDHGALELWTADYTYLNDRLARLYGVEGVSSTDFRRVKFPDSVRAGILGQGSFLASTSIGDRTSPTVRGTSILGLFTGTSVPNPPPNVPAISTTRSAAERPMRERIAQHTSIAACASCHQIFDPLGLALENFDSIGAFRSSEFGVPVDVSGVFTDGTPFSTVTEFRSRLVKYRDAYYSNIAQRLLGFALGRRPVAWRVYDYEMPAVRAVVREAAAKDFRWSSIVVGIIKSTPFQMKQIVP